MKFNCLEVQELICDGKFIKDINQRLVIIDHCGLFFYNIYVYIL